MDSPSQEIQINVKGPSELKLQITISTDKTVLDLKRAIAEKSDVEADRQRLIYSGRVLKDEDVLSTYKIQTSHTIHMVKGVARSNVSGSQTSSVPVPPLPTMQAGQNPHDPLTQLNSHLGYGALAGFNPFAEMGLNPNDPNMMQSMMQSPQFLQQMSSVMSNPAILDQIIASNPQLAAIAPQVREVFQSERFREMISNPESFRLMLQMASGFQGAGAGAGASPFGGAFGFPSAGGGGGFPAPGVPSTAPASSASSNPSTSPTSSQPAPNPFAAFFPPVPPASAGTGAGVGTNPFGMFDPAALTQMQAAFGGGGGGGLGGFGGFGAPPAAPADSRPPEERFQVQLQQLQDMGFTNASQNVRALLATGGNVHSAIEYILSGGGL
jgi:ubiquilin